MGRRVLGRMAGPPVVTGFELIRRGAVRAQDERLHLFERRIDEMLGIVDPPRRREPAPCRQRGPAHDP